MAGNNNDYRIVNVNGIDIHCPKHINRIARTNGWQIRLDRQEESYYSKHFADGKHGGTMGSLIKAEKHLESLMQTRKRTDQLFMTQYESNPYFHWSFPHKNSLTMQLQCQVNLCTWNYKKRIKSFYVCTENTYSEQLAERARKHAKAIAQWRDQIIDEFGREYLLTAELPEDLQSFAE